MDNNNPYAIRGKDFCNCDHAQMLLGALDEAHSLLVEGKVQEAMVVLRQAELAHNDAHDDYMDM